MVVTAEELGLTADNREVPLDLVLSQTRSVGEVRLRGPTIRVPDRIWHERPPRPRKLGLVSALNPFQPGGIWRTLTRGAAASSTCSNPRSQIAPVPTFSARVRARNSFVAASSIACAASSSTTP